MRDRLTTDEYEREAVYLGGLLLQATEIVAVIVFFGSFAVVLLLFLLAG